MTKNRVIQLRGGTGSGFTTKTVTVRKPAVERYEEERRKAAKIALEARFEQEAAVEAGAIRTVRGMVPGRRRLYETC